MKKYLLLLSAFAVFSAAQALDVVRNGRACAEIVLDANAPQGVKLAAKDLQDHLEKISGARLEIVHKPTGKFANRLFVGESEFTRKLGYQLPEFKNSGYDILIGKDYAVLNGPSMIYPPLKFDVYRNRKELAAYQKYIGGKYKMHAFDHGGGRFIKPLGIYRNDDIGPFHAVSALLESLGVRFYAPYEDGTVIPESKNIILKAGRTTKEAAYGRRDWFLCGDEPEGHLWLRRMKCGVHSGIVFNHTTRNFLMDLSNQKLHPNWYSQDRPGHFIQDLSEGGIPRYVDKDFQKAGVAWLDKLISLYPQLSGVALGCPDGTHKWDYRDKPKYCRPGMSDSQAIGNLFWDFHVAIAEELKKIHPDKNLLWFAPPRTQLPNNVDPKRIPDNIVIPPPACTPSTLVLPHIFREHMEFPAKLGKIFGKRRKAPAWEYWLDYRESYSPRYPIFFPKELQKYRQLMLPYSDGCFMEVNWARRSEGSKGALGDRIGCAKISAPMMYINSMLFWDPQLDMKALLDEYYKLYFGPAEKEMRAFFEYAEQVWGRNESRSVSATSGFLKEKDVEKFFALLSDARAKCPEGSVYSRRVGYLEKEYAPLKKLFSSLKRQGPYFFLHMAPRKKAPDGNFKSYRAWHAMAVNATGMPENKNRTEVSMQLTNDRKQLWIAVRCYETKMKKLAASCTMHDDSSIFEDDLVEVYIDTPERSYFKLAVNPAGTLFDTSTDISIITRDTLPNLWESKAKIWTKRFADRWEVEMMIPTDDFGKLGPTRQYPWGINVCRTRMVDLGHSGQKGYALAPTGGPYKLQTRWGQLWIR